jgi:hypothetical protein
MKEFVKTVASRINALSQQPKFVATPIKEAFSGNYRQVITGLLCHFSMMSILTIERNDDCI